MNEELQKQLAALLAGLMNVAGDAAQFAGAQIPPLVQEKIAFGRVWETALLILMIAATWVLAHWIPRFVKNVDHDESWIFAVISSLLGVCFTGIGSIVCLHDTLQVWFAPRLYIVEWLKTMVSK